jgi:hypothetical protein
VEHRNDSEEIEITDKILENIRIIDSLARIAGKCCANMPEYEIGSDLEVCLDLISEKAEEIRKWIRD